MGDDLLDRCHVPDAAPAARALARTTALVIGAHPDDAELLAPGVIAACRDDSQRWCTTVVCTDGSGSVAPPDEPELTGAALAARRAQEQREAARLGGCSATVLLGHASADLRAPAGARRLRAELAELAERTRPDLVVTHDPTDRHPTHVAVAAAVIDALRSLPAATRPARLVGSEGWRPLGWLPEADAVPLDVTGHEALAAALLGAHASQLGAKRYDLAAAGRRRSNATFADPRAADEATEVVLAMDLTATLDDDVDPVEAVAAIIDRFRRSSIDALAAAMAVGDRLATGGPGPDGDG